MLPFFSLAQSEHFSHVIPRAPQGGRIWWEKHGRYDKA